MTASIIIPVLNEEKKLKTLLKSLEFYQKQGHEVIVVDGGSQDKSYSMATRVADKVIYSEVGRAKQMNQGASAAQHDILWFLHADTTVPGNALENITENLKDDNVQWGMFKVKLSGSCKSFRIIELMMNFRSCITGIATGDQGIFVRRNIFNSVKGYREIPIMEDIELSKRLKNISKPVCLNDKLVTSSRRWEQNGILTTILLMWRLRFLYFIGSSTDKLARLYK